MFLEEGTSPAYVSQVNRKMILRLAFQFFLDGDVLYNGPMACAVKMCSMTTFFRQFCTVWLFYESRVSIS